MVHTTTHALPVTETFPFEITVVPQGSRYVSDSSKIRNPMNIKIKIRNKDEKMHRGIIYVPKLTLARSNSKKIRHINSDETILSFDLLMEQETAKKTSKRNQKIFQIFKPGTCLGSPSDEDQYPYAPSTFENINRLNAESSFERKRNDAFTLKKNPTVYSVESYSKSPFTFLGKCKPGGCLDPPFGEDNYSYEPTDVQKTSTDTNINTATPENKNILLPPMLRMGTRSTQNSRENDGRKVKRYSKNINNIGSELDLENCSNQNDSDSLITYPPALSLNELQTRSESVDKKKSQYGDKKFRKSQNEFSETFFKPQIDRKNRSIEKSEKTSVINVTISERNSSASKRSNGADDISLSKKSMPLRTSYTDKIYIHGHDVGTKYLEKYFFNKSDEDNDRDSRSAFENYNQDLNKQTLSEYITKNGIKDSISKDNTEEEAKSQYSRDSKTFSNNKQNSEVSVNHKPTESKCTDKDLLLTANNNIFRNPNYIEPSHEDYYRAYIESVSRKISTNNATLNSDAETISLETQKQNVDEKSQKSASILLCNNLHQNYISKITPKESSQSKPFNIITESTIKDNSGKRSNTITSTFLDEGDTPKSTIEIIPTAPSFTTRENNQIVAESTLKEDSSNRSNTINGSFLDEDSNDSPRKYIDEKDFDIMTTAPSLNKRENAQVFAESMIKDNFSNWSNTINGSFLDENASDMPKKDIDIMTTAPSFNKRENDQVVAESKLKEDSSNRPKTINGSFLDEDLNETPKIYIMTAAPSLIKRENNQIITESVYKEDSSNMFNTINSAFLDEDTNSDIITSAPSLDKRDNDQMFNKLKLPNNSTKSFSMVNDTDEVSNRLVDNINKIEITSRSKTENNDIQSSTDKNNHLEEWEKNHYDITHASKSASSESFKVHLYQSNISNIYSKLTTQEDSTKIAIVASNLLLAKASPEINVNNITPTSLNKSEKHSLSTYSTPLSIKTPPNTISMLSSYLANNKDFVYKQNSQNENITEKNQSIRPGSENATLDSFAESINEDTDLSEKLKQQLAETDNLDTYPYYEHDKVTNNNLLENQIEVNENLDLPNDSTKISHFEIYSMANFNNNTKINIENATAKNDQIVQNMSSNELLKSNNTYFSTSNRDSLINSIVEDKTNLKEISHDNKHSTNQSQSPINNISFTKKESGQDISQLIVALREGGRRINPKDSSNRFVNNVSLNLGFQTYTTDDNGTIISSFNPSLKPLNQPNEVITIVRTSINAQNGEVMVPMDSENDLIMRIIKKSTPSGQSAGYIKKSQEIINKKKSSNTKLKKYLNSVYESNLVPVENIIKSLRLEIDSVAQRNVLIKEIRKRKHMKSTKTYIKNRRCDCCNFTALNMKL